MRLLGPLVVVSTMGLAVALVHGDGSWVTAHH